MIREILPRLSEKDRAALLQRIRPEYPIEKVVRISAFQDVVSDLVLSIPDAPTHLVVDRSTPKHMYFSGRPLDTCWGDPGQQMRVVGGPAFACVVDGALADGTAVLLQVDESKKVTRVLAVLTLHGAAS